jgi:hypothetical protein
MIVDPLASDRRYGVSAPLETTQNGHGSAIEET